jgi:hypothetical protein
MLRDEVQALIDRLGAEALAWFLASDVAAVRSWGLGAANPPAAATAVVPFLSQLVEAVSQHEHSLFTLASAPAKPSPDGLTAAAQIRVAAGGTVEAPESEDPITRPLLRLAAQLAGVHLLRPDPALRTFLGTAGLAAGLAAREDHPLAVEAAHAATISLPLDRWTSEGRIVMRSFGGGGPFSTRLLATQLVTDSASRWLFHPEWPALEPFFGAVAESVAAFRRVADDWTAHVPALIGIAGIRLPQERPVTLPWGLLRAVRPHEAERLPESAVETVLEALVPFRVSVMDVGSIAFPKEIGEYLTTPLRLVRDTAFALLLAGLRPPRVSMTPNFRVITDPVQGIPQTTLSTVEPATPLDLSITDGSALETWSRAYADHHHRSLDVAVRRAVGAAGRRDTSDSFIDAVIGWDNLFGSAAGESQLRIATSFARLLEVDAPSRVRVARPVKADYDMRSRLVHGDLSELPPEDLADAPVRVLGLLLQALRVLYTERRDLLAMSSGQRSQALLLGGQ